MGRKGMGQKRELPNCPYTSCHRWRGQSDARNTMRVGMVRKKHWPYVGWGHKVLPGESFTNDITKAQGDSILRADMMKLCRLFSRFGRDSTLLSCLAYQVGPYRLLGSKDFPKSKLIQKLEAGNRDIYKEYISFRCYKGKVVPSIERRRKVEYLLLFEE